ncbi:hypothetical protein MLD38_032953 [Melastoma candidum]|uniref:Uncharacterized protein n=1 Tax=Melastoma candidum TaxID=119954 RepID=A0ACB9M521_9MYRT|nr:hypothetical protein MLD38_032953 [Melastoma candidum]
MTGNLDAVFPDAEYDFSSNFAMIEDGYKPFHGWNFKDASWSSGGAECKGDLSMPFDDWVLEAAESGRFPSDAPVDLMRSPRLPSWTFGYHPLFRNSTSDEEENAFELSVQSAASPGPYPASLRASSSQDPDYMARLPLLTDGIPSRSSPLSNYPFLAEDCSFYDWIPNESSHRKHRQPCPRPTVESFVISSGFDLRLLSPVGLAGHSGTLTRFPYQVPLPSFQDGESETLDDSPVGVAADPTCHFYESQFCLHLERSSLYLLSISDREDPCPGLP